MSTRLRFHFHLIARLRSGNQGTHTPSHISYLFS